jgi:hypothetical protein
MRQGSINVGNAHRIVDGSYLMLTALILVCSLASVPDIAACTRDNAVQVMYVPATFANPVTCFMQGQAYLAETSIGRDLAENEVVKVICSRSAQTDAQPARAGIVEAGR